MIVSQGVQLKKAEAPAGFPVCEFLLALSAITLSLSSCATAPTLEQRSQRLESYKQKVWK
jgi:hypothetical protein